MDQMELTIEVLMLARIIQISVLTSPHRVKDQFAHLVIGPLFIGLVTLLMMEEKSQTQDKRIWVIQNNSQSEVNKFSNAGNSQFSNSGKVTMLNLLAQLTTSGEVLMSFPQ